MDKLKLPQFKFKRSVSFEAHTFEKDKEERYELILGRDFMQSIRLNMFYNFMQFQWGGIKLSIVRRGFWKKSTMRGFQHFNNNKISKNEIYLLDVNYKKVDLRDLSKNQPQLTETQQELLFNLLSKYDSLFQGKLGTWKGPLIHIESKADVEPYHVKPFSIQHSIYPVLEKEVKRLVKIGVLSPNPLLMLAAPSFAIPKKD